MDKTKIVRGVLDKELCKHAAASLILSEMQGAGGEDLQVPGSTIYYHPPIGETILLSMLNRMEEETGLELLPTYSFSRVYRKGDALEKHTDRPSCEISATVTLAGIAKDIWPIYADDSGPIELAQGDILIYRGCEVEHWREPFEGEIWIQLFVHYVDKNGPYTDHALDKRNILKQYATLHSCLENNFKY